MCKRHFNGAKDAAFYRETGLESEPLLPTAREATTSVS